MEAAVPDNRLQQIEEAASAAAAVAAAAVAAAAAAAAVAAVAAAADESDESEYCSGSEGGDCDDGGSESQERAAEAAPHGPAASLLWPLARHFPRDISTKILQLVDLQEGEDLRKQLGGNVLRRLRLADRTSANWIDATTRQLKVTRSQLQRFGRRAARFRSLLHPTVLPEGDSY